MATKNSDMNYKKIITIMSIVIVMAAIVISGCDMESDAERIELLEDYLHNTYKGKFVLASEKTIASENNKAEYGYRFVTVDDRQIEFTAYYDKGSLFDRTYHMTADLDYAIAEYVIDKSEFALEHDITNEALEQTAEKLYKLTIEQQRILEEYGQTWFVPPLGVHLIYQESEIEFYLLHTSSKESIYRGLLRELMNIDEHYHEQHNHDENE